MDSSVLIYMFKADLYFEYIPSMAKVNLPPYTFKYLSYNKHIPIHGSRIFFQPGGGGVSGIFKSGTTPIPVGEFFRTSSPSTCNPRMFTQSRNHVPMCMVLFLWLFTRMEDRGIASPESLSFLYRVINFYLPSSSK